MKTLETMGWLHTLLIVDIQTEGLLGPPTLPTVLTVRPQFAPTVQSAGCG